MTAFFLSWLVTHPQLVAPSFLELNDNTAGMRSGVLRNSWKAGLCNQEVSGCKLPLWWALISGKWEMKGAGEINSASIPSSMDCSGVQFLPTALLEKSHVPCEHSCQVTCWVSSWVMSGGMGGSKLHHNCCALFFDLFSSFPYCPGFPSPKQSISTLNELEGSAF